MSMKQLKVTTGGQVSIPAEIRRRWDTSRLTLEDRGEEIVLRPAAADPIAALRGSLTSLRGATTRQLRQQARADERAAEERRRRSA